MLTLQLYIEGQEVDLFSDESVTLTQTIQDVMDIEKVFTDFSKSFNVPASKVNNKIFKHFYNPTIVGFDPRYKKDAELHLNYKLFKKGKIKLESSSKKDNKAHTYKLTFFGTTISLKDLIGEDKLDNLNYLHKFYGFNYTNANIKTYMENGLDVDDGEEVISDGILFPMITHTKRLIYNSNHTSDNVNTATLNNIAYIANADYGLEISQLKPAIRVHSIIKAIEKQYNLSFTTDFFNSTNLNYYNLYMWLHNRTGGLTDEDDIFESFVSDYTFTNDKGRNYISVKSGSFELVGAPQKAINVVVVPASNNPFNVVIYRDGQELERYDGVSLNYNNNTEWALRIEKSGDIEGQVLGDYAIAIESATANTFDLRIAIRVNRSSTILAESPEIRLKATAEVGTNERININKQLPDIKVLDFLTGIFKMFNLTAFRKDNGDVEVKTLDDFYGDSTTTWDVTDQIDKTAQEVTSTLPYKQLDFGYEGTDTFLAKSHEESFKKSWGELNYNVDRKFDGKIYKVNLPFEHMKFERLADGNGGSLTGIQWGWSADIKQDASVGQPILFYPILKTATFGILDLEGAISQKTQAYMPSNSIEFTDSFNINFSSEYNEYAQKPFASTLFETYYKNYISEVFDPQKRLLKTKAYLPLSMLSQFSLADKIRIFDILYRINKITTNFETMRSDLELINTKAVFGEAVVIETKTPERFINIEKCLRADSTDSIAKHYNRTADAYCDVEGFDLMSTRELIPDNLDGGNNPKPLEYGTPIIVTPPVIQTVTPIYVTSTEIFLAFNVAQLGKIGEVNNIDELGFFYSTTESDLESTNIDTLKGTSGVTNIPFVQHENQKHQDRSEFRESAKVGGLSSGTTLYWRFYGRTNIDPLYLKADAISEIQTATTT